MDFKIDKKYYKEWRWGFIEGMILGLLLLIVLALTIAPFIFLEHNLLMFWTFIGVLFLSGLKFLDLFKDRFKNKTFKTKQDSNPISKARNSRKPCPECGSIARHRKDCSRGKKNEPEK